MSTKIRFSSSALEAIRLAQENATHLGHSYVGSEHLLLGLACQEYSIASTLLINIGVTSVSIRTAIIQRVGMGVSVQSLHQGLTPYCRRAIGRATSESHKLGQTAITAEHLLLGLLLNSTCAAYLFLKTQNIDISVLYHQLIASMGGEQMPSRPVRGKETERPNAETRQLDLCSRDLTRMATEGKLDPVIGRQPELQRIIQILSRRSKNNPVLIGDPGVGKTAIAEALAIAISDGTAPSHLLNKRICSLDLAAMVAGTKYRGEFEDKLRNVLQEVRKSGNIILFLDELHTIVGAGSAEGAIDAANILKPALSRGELQVLGATTSTEYRKYIEKDAALERRFQPITVSEPTRDETLSILRGLRGRYESHHHLTIKDETLESAIDLSYRYLPHRFWPDKAIDLMDEAAAQTRLAGRTMPADLLELSQRVSTATQQLNDAIRNQDFERAAMLRDAEGDFRRQLETRRHHWKSEETCRVVEPQHIRDVLSQWTGVPITSPSEQDKMALLALEDTLKSRLIGQDEAVKTMTQAIRRSRMGLKDPQRPVGSFLLLGPSGVGKTELCRILAETLFGNRDALIRFDMSEYMEAHAISRLIGAPPGYVGHDEGGQLTERVRRRPWSVVLLDELEKAHADIWSLLLQIMEEGVLTDSQGRPTDFRNTVFVMTSNLGSRRFTEGQRLGFSPDDRTSRKHLEQEVLGDAKKTFPPEFINRLDNLLVFHPLEADTLTTIVRQLLTETESRLKALNLKLTVDEDAIALLATTGRDRQYGARPLRRTIAAWIENPASDILLKDDVPIGSTLRVWASDGAVKVELI